jgi:hypothetical protein
VPPGVAEETLSPLPPAPGAVLVPARIATPPAALNAAASTPPATVPSPRPDTLPTDDDALLMPELSYGSVEETLIEHDQLVGQESDVMGDFVCPFRNKITFQVSCHKSSLGRELFGQEQPWGLWGELPTLGLVRQFVNRNMEDAMVARLLRETWYLKLYAAAAFIPEGARGPLQKRYVTRIALHARDGILSPETTQTITAVHRVIRDWMKVFNESGGGVDLGVPDFSSCF